MKKRILAMLLAFAMVFGLAACQESGGTTAEPTESVTESAADSTGESDQAPTVVDGGDTDIYDDPGDGRFLLKRGMKVKDVDVEVVEKVIQETALAYYYANPNTQYDVFTPNTIMPESVGSGRITSRLAPEFAFKEMKYYGVCRSFTADIIWDAFHYVCGGLDGTGCGANMGRSVYEYGSMYKARARVNGTLGEVESVEWTDKQAMLDEMQNGGLRPGDFILATPNTGQSGHVLMFLGDCFDTGVDYIMHCWPVNGGKWDPETGKEGEEPFGGVTLQTAEEFIFTGNGSPNWNLRADRMTDIIAYRFTNFEPFQEAEFTDAAITRYNKRGLHTYKTPSVGIYETVLKGEQVTITETIDNQSDEDYWLTVTEHIAEGTEFVSSSSTTKDQGSYTDKGIIWHVKVPAYGSVDVSYVTKVTADAGTVLDYPTGTVGLLPTRNVRMKVGQSRITLDEEDELWALTKYIPDFLNTGTFMDMDFLNVVYKRVVGVETNFPKTVQEYLNMMYDVKFPAKTDSTYMLCEKKVLPAESEYLNTMRILRFSIGKCIYLPDLMNTDRALITKEEFFKEGDVLIEAHGYNMQTITDIDSVSISVYLGAGYILRHTTKGTTLEKFSDVWEKMQSYKIAIVLRPSYYYDLESK